MDSVPVVSQVKSLVQWLSGDDQGALQTQENFSKQCPIVSQARSAVHAVMGDYEQAQHVQKVFLNSAQQFIDGTPVIGHLKGGVHYITGQREKGDDCMKAASRTTGTIIGGVMGGLAGGPPGAVAGGIAGGIIVDQITTGVDSLVHGEFRPAGIFAKMKQIRKKHDNNENISGDVFDLAMMPVADGMAGYCGYRTVQKIQLNQQTTKTFRVMAGTEVKEAVKTQQMKPGYNQYGPLAQTCISESVQHQRPYLVNKIKHHPELKMGDVQVRVDRKWYNNMKETNLIEQKNSYQINKPLVDQGKVPKNIFTKERLHHTNKVNINIKGPENLKQFNNNIVQIKQIDPRDLKYTNKVTRKIARYGREPIQLVIQKNRQKQKQQTKIRFSYS